MDPNATLRADDIARLSQEAKGHSAQKALGALCYDLLSRQGEGQTLFTGRELVETRAAEHGVEREQAESESGNVLTVLTRGPSTSRERGLIAAFAVLGLEASLADDDDDARSERVARFVRHADWLEVATPYVVYPFVDVLCEEATVTAVWVALADAALADQEPAAASRARNAARLSALTAASGAAARQERERLAREASDPAVRSLAALLSGTEPDEPEAPRLSGRLGRVPTPSVRTVLRWVSGVAALSWLLTALGLVVGFKREASLEIIEGGVRLRHRTRLLGRVIREGEETYTLAALAGAGRRVRYPALPLLVGMLALSIGVLIGGVFLFEGLWSGETVLLIAAAAAVAIGGGLDLGLSVLFPGRVGRVAVDLHVLPKRSIRLRDVNREQADRFLEVLGRRVARRHA